MNAEAVLQRAEELGLKLTAVGNRIQCRPGTATPPDFVEMLKANKTEVMRRLRVMYWLDVPWPLGFGGLPAKEMLKAEAASDRAGERDPIYRRLALLEHLWSFFTRRGDRRMAGEMHQAYEELHREDRTIRTLCQLCTITKESV